MNEYNVTIIKDLQKIHFKAIGESSHTLFKLLLYEFGLCDRISILKAE